MSDQANKPQKSHHKKATGAALNTVKMHSKENDLKLFGSCFWYRLPQSPPLPSPSIALLIRYHPVPSSNESGSPSKSKA